MLPAPLHVTPAAARRFLRRALRLDTPAPDVAAALAHLGYVQIDPVNVCGRMHDLILRNRVAGYREGDLHQHIHFAERPGFEHYLPHFAILVAFPIDAWPYLAGLIQRRRLRRGAYRRKLAPKHEQLAQRILAEIAARGPLSADEIEHEGTSLTAWGTPGRLVKNILEVLFVHGRVLITKRRNFRRVYDLPERVLPPPLLAAPPIPDRQVDRWMVLNRLRQRRLVRLSGKEVAQIAGDIQPVLVDGCPALYCLREDVPMFDLPAPTAASPDPPLLLAPLDPLIYDRRITQQLWGFHYTWEAYLPEAKRKRGHYALPVLAGTELVGHVDPKADRAAGRLRVVSRSVRRGHRVGPAVSELARFLGLNG